MCWFIDGPYSTPIRKISYFIQIDETISEKIYYRGGTYKFYPGENMCLTEIKKWVIENLSPSLVRIDHDHEERLTLKFSCKEDVVAFKLKWL